MTPGLTPEITVLALAGLLQVIQYALMAVPANRELGTGKTSSPRDADRLGGPMVDLLSKKTARLYRAMNNHFEGLIMFTLGVVVVTLSGQANALTAMACYIYLVARIIYVPAYYFGWRPWRSLIWFVGFFATLALYLVTLSGHVI